MTSQKALLLSIFILCTLLYFISGFDKIINFKTNSTSIQTKINLDSNIVSDILLIIAIIIEILAPILIIVSMFSGRKSLGMYSAISLAVFTVVATLLYHFPPTQKKHYHPFISNMTSTGCMLLIAYVFYTSE